MTNSNLDAHFQGWLSAISQQWKVNIEEAVQWLGGVSEEDEIENRLTYYPQLAQLLSTTPLDMQQFANVVKECWALGGRFNQIRFTEFVDKGDLAVESIQKFMDKFPGEDHLSKERIDNFVAEAINLGYENRSRTRSSADLPGAALLASVILTALYPHRFVDYRQTRWKDLAQALHYDLFRPEASYGEQLIWAGRFAAELSKTETFRRYWPEEQALWIIAGICWIGPTPEKPARVPPSQQSFPEGDKKQRWHEYRERNSKVIQSAKQQAYDRDPWLRCEACGFSFVKYYGEHGEDFIEAHHKIPIATLKPGSRTRVEDIALLCANCHRMIHYKGLLSIDELRDKIRKPRTSLT